MSYSNSPYIFKTTDNELIPIYVSTIFANTLSNDGSKLCGQYAVQAKANTVWGIKFGNVVLVNKNVERDSTYHTRILIMRINESTALLMGQVIRDDGEVTALTQLIDSSIDFSSDTDLYMYVQSNIEPAAEGDVTALGSYIEIMDN